MEPPDREFSTALLDEIRKHRELEAQHVELMRQQLDLVRRQTELLEGSASMRVGRRYYSTIMISLVAMTIFVIVGLTLLYFVRAR